MEHIEQKHDDNIGSIKIADDVVAVIAGLAATEIKGVTAMSGGIAGGIAEILGKKNLAKGVKVDLSENEAKIDLYVITEYGINMLQVAEKIQENVKKTIENMTGLNVVHINVNIQGVVFSSSEKNDKKTE